MSVAARAINLIGPVLGRMAISCIRLGQAEGGSRKLLVPIEIITRACPSAIISLDCNHGIDGCGK